MSCDCGCSDEHQVIDITGGEVDFLRPTRLTELKGVDITGDVVVMSVGSQNTAGTWLPMTSPHKLTFGTILSQDFKLANPSIPVAVPFGTTLYWVEGELLIGGSGVTGLVAGTTYWPRIKLADTPATVIRRGESFLVT